MWELLFISERQNELLVKKGYIYICKTEKLTNLMGQIPCILGRELEQHVSGSKKPVFQKNGEKQIILNCI